MPIREELTSKKKEWTCPQIFVIPFNRTKGGENQIDNEDTYGKGYDPTPSQG